VTQNYPIAGTLSYIAPEVLKKILIDKSDIWSSAILMTILMTGWSPFRGINEC
jgi:serine/threonine protein kinase